MRSRARIPGHDVAVGVEQINGVVLDAVDEWSAGAGRTARNCFLRRALLGNVANKAHHRRPLGGLSMGLSMMSTGNSLLSLRSP